ncbi:vacuolar-processing enzyme-like [Spinacia oleracea]|uniref:Vacuolar-processing enzyme-like n=1 Tax=Spinacia oleracea TaxID=3562 RepID=A0ABM3R1B7_SPIOL|nr:vacuolar-processing enzyme-like [Spinacia oleracea]XP_056689420.1 vacuolar-processing enzyme-like [Spinacia oleracea]
MGFFPKKPLKLLMSLAALAILGCLLKKLLKMFLTLVAFAIVGYGFTLFLKYPDSDLSKEFLSILNSDTLVSDSGHKHSMFPDSGYKHHTIDYNKLPYAEVEKAPEESVEQKQAQTNLDYEFSKWKHADCTFVEIAKSLFGDENGYQMNTTNSSHRDLDCVKKLYATYESVCGPVDPYVLYYSMAFLNVCDAGFLSKFKRVASQVCSSKCSTNI